MKLYFLGTCAGTEPMPNRQHASMVLESGDALYWFDAGEGCSRTAHLMGLDLLKVKRILISHTHMDHVGGLGNLLWNIRKLTWVRDRKPFHGEIQLFIPNMATWEGVSAILENSEKNLAGSYSLSVSQTREGLVFDDGYVKVTACPNNHIKTEPGMWLSYSYVIECEGRRLVYSGDLGKLTDLDPMLSKACDSLIIETGHFSIDGVRDYLADKNYGKLFFTHNGREILNHPEKSKEKVQQYFEGKAIICQDGMIAEL